ncbi:hypothetical protein D3273_02110 [Lichenibacterium minor]|uniref:Uncharacterized protein n=1 Tax=Lichenibacterium minor TaxID=2316528 RepID=A0A4Q2UFQ2_9HYPH|nr:hypothetical protein [Lichenibacterium minor]RYC34067.1 hypothetical protein D3273_02110 [Lichenibacterium minor]
MLRFAKHLERLDMCITPEERRAAFDEIVTAVQNESDAESFSSIIQAFNAVFQQVNEAHGWPYTQEDGQRARCIFFFPFSSESAHWQGSIEILKSTSHYTVFDRLGKFAIYDRNSPSFGNLVVTNSKNNAIAKLEGLSAVDFLSSIANFSGRIKELEEARRLLRLREKDLMDQLDVLEVKIKNHQNSILNAIRSKFRAKRQ